MTKTSLSLALHTGAALFGALLIAVTLWAWGQPLICPCGRVDFWVGSIWDSGNSQHIADWYTPSHFVHGLMIVLLGRMFVPRAPMVALLGIAIVTGTAWEILEHTDFVLNTFRANTVNQGYVGDSVLNAVSDYLFMLGGFFIASRLQVMQIVTLAVGLELTAAVIGRDSLVLEAVMLTHHFEAIDTWQQRINPATRAVVDP